MSEKASSRNTAGMRFFEIAEIEVAEWHPLPDGEGPPTQVHMAIRLEGNHVPLVARFKGPDTLGALIAALREHRDNVWPDAADAKGGDS